MALPCRETRRYRAFALAFALPPGNSWKQPGLRSKSAEAVKGLRWTWRLLWPGKKKKKTLVKNQNFLGLSTVKVVFS